MAEGINQIQQILSLFMSQLMQSVRFGKFHCEEILDICMVVTVVRGYEGRRNC